MSIAIREVFLPWRRGPPPVSSQGRCEGWMNALHEVHKAIPKRRAFVSYAWGDGRGALTAIDHALAAAGIETVVDHERLAPGDELPRRIASLIDGCDVVLVVLTRAAVSSPWVRREIEHALATCRHAGLGRPLIVPIRWVDEVEIPAALADRVHVSPDQLSHAIERAGEASGRLEIVGDLSVDETELRKVLRSIGLEHLAPVLPSIQNEGHGAIRLVVGLTSLSLCGVGMFAGVRDTQYLIGSMASRWTLVLALLWVLIGIVMIHSISTRDNVSAASVEFHMAVREGEYVRFIGLFRACIWVMVVSFLSTPALVGLVAHEWHLREPAVLGCATLFVCGWAAFALAYVRFHEACASVTRDVVFARLSPFEQHCARLVLDRMLQRSLTPLRRFACLMALAAAAGFVWLLLAIPSGHLPVAALLMFAAVWGLFSLYVPTALDHRDIELSRRLLAKASRSIAHAGAGGDPGPR